MKLKILDRESYTSLPPTTPANLFTALAGARFPGAFTLRLLRPRVLRGVIRRQLRQVTPPSATTAHLALQISHRSLQS
ncbi:hypothetical protein E2C01_090885 [Portunus trituberculatus]|uniref:Uncharacterized protein n=1 Tax=Portunus trituberculatus TaxID=210409 RepID=A0A5B7JTL5_PORTR|nr:hypothetical protein [Portunus trituberculatus]